MRENLRRIQRRIQNLQMQFRNAFLSSMDPSDLEVLSPHLRETALCRGQTLCAAGEFVASIYFPSGSAIGSAAIMRDGRSVETATIGYENVAGLLPGLTQSPSPGRMFVQIGGGAISLPVDKLRARAAASPTLMDLILRFAQAGAAQAEQSAACNALHPLTSRLARWILTCDDRVDQPNMTLTQGDLAVMCGALRSSVSIAASEFKRDGLIRYSRGLIDIIDRPRLERQSCECYSSDRARWRRLCSAA
jgi:CRP-like cAMP-binding protein